ncbi:MAG: hypothetical protein JNM98_21390 [Rhodocyclaceae bacterium]|nr:hypothetical protein [Rhodocyclaceae bacterium]
MTHAARLHHAQLEQVSEIQSKLQSHQIGEAEPAIRRQMRRVEMMLAKSHFQRIERIVLRASNP